jgi:hypothetical protein
MRLVFIDDGPLSSDPPTWHLSVSAGASPRLRFQVVAPDQAGSYKIETTIKVDGVAIADPPVFEVGVAGSSADDLAGVIVALEGTTVDPSEHGLVQSAIALLRGARGLEPQPLLLEVKIRLAAEAGETLGRVHGADLSRERGEVDRLIAAWERAWYDWTLGLVTGGMLLEPARMALRADPHAPPPAWRARATTPAIGPSP